MRLEAVDIGCRRRRVSRVRLDGVESASRIGRYWLSTRRRHEWDSKVSSAIRISRYSVSSTPSSATLDAVEPGHGSSRPPRSPRKFPPNNAIRGAMPSYELARMRSHFRLHFFGRDEEPVLRLRAEADGRLHHPGRGAGGGGVRASLPGITLDGVAGTPDAPARLLYRSGLEVLTCTKTV